MAKDNLAELIENSGYKVGYVAENMGLSTSGFWKMRQDPSTRMNAVQMVKLADVLGIDIDEVFDAVKKI